MPSLARKLPFLICLAIFPLQVSLFGDDSPGAQPAPAPSWDRGWQPLMDGVSTQGWRPYGSNEPIRGWKVIDGAIVRVSDGAGDIVTDEQFDHFELEFEYQIAPGGNSGVMFHVDESLPSSWMSGPEIQILDNEKGADPQHAGWLYGLYKPHKPKRILQAEEAAGVNAPQFADATRPAGQWNHVYLRVAPNQGVVLINGVRYYRFQKGSPDWLQRVKKSKFSAYPTFGTAPKGHLCLQDHGDRVAYRNLRVRRLHPDGTPVIPNASPLPIRGVPAFVGMGLPQSHPSIAEGKPATIRPIAMHDVGHGTHLLGIQSGAIYEITSQGGEHQMSEVCNLFDRVADFRKGNEEGLLGLAPHPEYATNRQLFVYYTAKDSPRRSIVSRLTPHNLQNNDPEPFKEDILLTIPQPFANHNGGSIALGPDGYLYIGLGDGGGQNDPLANGQNNSNLLGSILRIDVNHKTDDLPYGLPSDNPFTDVENARDEIYAYGFRNVWQLSFDRETGDLWAADVGQDRYEEINRIVPGGNYGWSLREGLIPFQNPLHAQSDNASALIEPIWQYDRHDGRSITGGFVYRGDDLPMIDGHYLFADYVSGKMWALTLSADRQRALGAIPLQGNGLPIIAFARDRNGAAYFLTEGVPEKAIYRLELVSPARH